MFTIDATITDLKVKERNLFKVLFSMNTHQVATPELSVEDARSYVFFFRDGGKVQIYVGLYFINTDRRMYYTHSSNPFPEAQMADVEDEARAFAEGLGAMLDEIDFGKLSTDDKNNWIEEQEFFSGKKEASAAVQPPVPPQPDTAVPDSPAAPAPEPAAEQQPVPPAQPAPPRQPPVIQAAPVQSVPADPAQPVPVVQPAQTAPQPVPTAQPVQSAPVQAPPVIQQAVQPAPPVPAEPPVLTMPLDGAPAPALSVDQTPRESVPPETLVTQSPLQRTVRPRKSAAPAPAESEAMTVRLPDDVLEQAVKEGVVKAPKTQLKKEIRTAAGGVSRDKEALARLLASF